MIQGNAVDELTPITSIEYRLVNQSDWTACSPKDNSFDELDEKFICHIPKEKIRDDSIIQIRSTDSKTNVNTLVERDNQYSIFISEVSLLVDTGVELSIVKIALSICLVFVLSQLYNVKIRKSLRNN